MTYQAILFDLDGTLLPMDLDQFTEGYFHLFGPDGCPVWLSGRDAGSGPVEGCGSDGEKSGQLPNCEAFWETFAQVLGPQVYDHIPIFDAFYATEFQKARSFTGPNPRASQAVALARRKAERVILATNPLFPTGRRPDPAELGGAPAGGLRLGHRL